MEEITRDLFVSISAFATIFGVVYVFLLTRHRERMSMLEKGVDPSAFSSPNYFTSFALKLGMLSVGISIGTLIGNILYRNGWLDKSVAYSSMLFMFGGISLILNFLIDKKNRK